MRVRVLVILGLTLLTACGGSAEHWRGGHPVCVSTACPRHGSLTAWSAVSVKNGDDRTLMLRVPTACGEVNAVQPVKMAQNQQSVVIGFYGPRLVGGICASSSTVTIRLAAPLQHRTVYDAKTGKPKPVTSDHA